MAVIAIVVIVYLAGVTGMWSPTPDSALYQGLGRSLARGEGYVFNGVTSTTVTPGYPVILAGLRLVFGDGFWAPNALAAVSGMMALGLAYLVFRRLGPPRLALTAVFVTGMSYTFFNNSHRILTDAPSAMLLWGLLWVVAYRARLTVWSAAAACVLAVAGILVRAPGVLLLGAVAVGIGLDRVRAQRRRALATGAC
ncbi:MAG: glycosyltransferase family 39 protein [Planctomycetota bacterium]